VSRPERTAVLCPKCGGGIFFLRTSRNEVDILCMQPGCGHSWLVHVTGTFPGEIPLDTEPASSVLLPIAHAETLLRFLSDNFRDGRVEKARDALRAAVVGVWMP
jgi:hypothetical protein